MQNKKPSISTTKSALKKQSSDDVEVIEMLDYLNHKIIDCDYNGRDINPLVLSGIIDVIYRLLIGGLVKKKYTLADLKNEIDSRL